MLVENRYTCVHFFGAFAVWTSSASNKPRKCQWNTSSKFKNINWDFDEEESISTFRGRWLWVSGLITLDVFDSWFIGNTKGRVPEKTFFNSSFWNIRPGNTSIRIFDDCSGKFSPFFSCENNFFKWKYCCPKVEYHGTLNFADFLRKPQEKLSVFNLVRKGRLHGKKGATFLEKLDFYEKNLNLVIWDKSFE